MGSRTKRNPISLYFFIRTPRGKCAQIRIKHDEKDEDPFIVKEIDTE